LLFNKFLQAPSRFFEAHPIFPPVIREIHQMDQAPGFLIFLLDSSAIPFRDGHDPAECAK